ncbi:oxidoreductase domain-containing protein [Dendryphion nanum]|uniref:D-xylose 1-dehydrogenase (NADP(+), D-xylono-1,5-lactone-forming) n=1 Tax=Dendryphion nanum TaxID=256645 RepID=A0A9P9DX09_9PLEO|nr:oxidoreductase domain-containing protein [Dendryphion nanum]
MSGFLTFLKRFYRVLNPPVVPKRDGALRFGILGAANIAPQSIIAPAKYHSEVVIAAVAARDPKKAEAYAKKHNIPIVHKTYDDLIGDPSIDCIYNPLPNGLHYEWTLKALKAGKSVLLEKPSVSNAAEAKSLFRHPILRNENAPVLLEAFHYRFHPAWQSFLTLIDASEVEHVEVKNSLFPGLFAKDDIRFNYSLSGGALMDFGTYAVSSMRGIFRSEPTEITTARSRPLPNGRDDKIDEAMDAEYLFANGGTAKISVDVAARGGYWFPSLTKSWPSFANFPPTIKVRLSPKEDIIPDGSRKTTKRELAFHNYMGPFLWHRIDITTTTTFYAADQSGKIVKTEKKTESKKEYSWSQDGHVNPGEAWWTTYRYQLEEFVNKVKGRKGSGVWISGEDSIAQMETIDQTYLKSGLPLRPTSQALE